MSWSSPTIYFFLSLLFFLAHVKLSTANTLELERELSVQQDDNSTLTTETTSTTSVPLRIGLILNNSPSNLGWDYNHDLARVAMEKKYGKDVVVFQVRLNAGYDTFLSKAEELINAGCKVLFLASDYSDLRAILLNRWKHVLILTFGAYQTGPRHMDTAVNSHEVYFAAGILSALTSKTGKVGFLSAFYFATAPSVNAFFYGGRLINPSLQLLSIELQNWNEITRADKGVEILKDKYNADFITSLMSNSEVQSRASKLNINTFGYPSELVRVLYGETVISGCVLSWIDVYDQTIQMVMNNTWKQNHTFDYGMAEGVASLASFSTEVTYEVINQLQPWIDAVKKKKICPNDIPSYSQRIKEVFPADVKDSNGCVLFSLLGWKGTLDDNITNLGYLTDDQVFSPIYI